MVIRDNDIPRAATLYIETDDVQKHKAQSSLAQTCVRTYTPLVRDWNQSPDRLCIGIYAFFGALTCPIADETNRRPEHSGEHHLMNSEEDQEL